ncbi:MAG: hypothetical protein IPO93_08735 [Actinobacteria bacterium]|nr:hypothetical protein [Actinomycetota bacterium]
MRPIARVLVDESHRQAWSTRSDVASRMNPVNPADASYERAAAVLASSGLDVVVHAEGTVDDRALADTDVLVIPHAADDEWERTTGTGYPRLTLPEIKAIKRFVAGGGGVVILAETEQAKYGNNFAELAGIFGIEIESTTVQDPAHAYKDVPTWVLADLIPGARHDLTARVGQACFYRAGTLRSVADDDGTVIETVAQTSNEADPARAGLLMTSTGTAGRVVVVSDSDLFGDDSITALGHEQLWLNIVTWAAGGRVACTPTQAASTAAWIDGDAAWASLVGAIEALRPMQAKDGSIDLAEHSADTARGYVDTMVSAIAALAPRFSHQADHLAATIVDLQSWAAGGFAVPDFLDSLVLFRPDMRREDGIEHFAVFPMYTQNGNPNRNLEAVVVRTFWPDWLAEQERSHVNAAFVPIEFVGFTGGYDTHSAVLFPETVATRETADFHWGGIFCDREAARFRVVSRAAADTLRLSLPPDADLLLNDQRLAQETFVLWDLIHDRTHSHGDLPFDPFMIKQRMPYWMYALEELRCDLSTFRETIALDTREIHLGRFIRYAILFDRLFRFTITGSRVRNYDGLGGQIIFAWLHRDGVLHWTDNMLTIDWFRVNDSMIALCDEVDALYRGGIGRSRVAQWIAAHEFVSALVEPHPLSMWAQGPQALPLDGEPKAMVDVVLPDEFPLNVFYDALQRKLATTIDATSGITA